MPGVYLTSLAYYPGSDILYPSHKHVLPPSNSIRACKVTQISPYDFPEIQGNHMLFSSYQLKKNLQAFKFKKRFSTCLQPWLLIQFLTTSHALWFPAMRNWTLVTLLVIIHFQHHTHNG